MMLVAVLVLSDASFARAQTDSMGVADVVPRIKKSPMGAVIRSALLPGLGQWYNEQKIKALIVFGGEAALVGNIFFYRQKARDAEIEENQLFYEDLQSRFTWIFAAVHLLNMLDAFVDAHLFDFDAGPDLSVGVDPPSVGVMISLSFPL